jgi:hypothetical protein
LSDQPEHAPPACAAARLASFLAEQADEDPDFRTTELRAAGERAALLLTALGVAVLVDLDGSYTDSARLRPLLSDPRVRALAILMEGALRSILKGGRVGDLVKTSRRPGERTFRLFLSDENELVSGAPASHGDAGAGGAGPDAPLGAPLCRRAGGRLSDEEGISTSLAAFLTPSAVAEGPMAGAPFPPVPAGRRISGEDAPSGP